MRRYMLFFFMAFMSMPLLCHGQDDAVAMDVDAYVEELNAQCPMDYKDDWGFNSFTMVGDSYALVDFMVPSSLTMFFSSLTGNKDNVKQMWIRQFEQYGDKWKHFVELMVEANRRIIINLRPKGSDDTALITLLPSDFSNKQQ